MWKYFCILSCLISACCPLLCQDYTLNCKCSTQWWIKDDQLRRKLKAHSACHIAVKHRHNCTTGIVFQSGNQFLLECVAFFMSAFSLYHIHIYVFAQALYIFYLCYYVKNIWRYGYLPSLPAHQSGSGSSSITQLLGSSAGFKEKGTVSSVWLGSLVA